MPNAVIYARFSSSRQREESIEGQVKECKAFAEYAGYDIIKVYADRAISGRTDDRPQFLQMIADSAKKTFNYVLVYTFDRFSRDSYASAIYKHKLKLNGVKVLSAKERTDDSPAGVLMERVFEGFAEYYSLELGQKVIRGMRLNATKGIWSSGAPPFGYMKDTDGKLVPHPEQAPALRHCFEMASGHYTFSAICDYLNNQGFRPPNARKHGFKHQNIFRVLQNTIAIDRFVWDDVVIEPYNNCRIVSDELFAAVQCRINSSNRKGVVNMTRSSEYALSGKIECGECGKLFYGSSGTSSNKVRHYYYRCGGSNTGKKKICSMPSIQRDELEGAIYKGILDILHNEKILHTIAKEAMDFMTCNEDEDLLKKKKRLTQANAEADKVVDAIAATGINDRLRDKLNALEEEIKSLENYILMAPAPAKPIPITEEMVVSFLKKMSKESKRSLLQTMVNKVIVNKKDDNEEFSVTVFLNYTPTATVSNSFATNVVPVRVGYELAPHVQINKNFLIMSLKIKHYSRRAAAALARECK